MLGGWISHGAFSLVLDSLTYTLRPCEAGRRKRDSGDDSTRAPPLPIPNREVKPCNADGTAKAGEQVIAVLLEKASGRMPFLFYAGGREMGSTNPSSVAPGKVEPLQGSLELI